MAAQEIGDMIHRKYSRQDIGDTTHRKYSRSSISPVGLGTCIIQAVEEQLEIHM